MGAQANTSLLLHCLILSTPDRRWVREVLCPALLPAASVVVIAAASFDSGPLGRAIEELRPCIVVLEQDLLAGGIRLGLPELSALAFPARLVVLMREVDTAWTECILDGNVGGVLVEGTCGQTCASALSKVSNGEIWLTRWVLSHALVLLRASRADDLRAKETGIKPDRPLLTPRERAIALLVAGGLSNKAVASRINRSIDTVKKHLSSIYAKLRVGDRSELAAQFHRKDRET